MQSANQRYRQSGSSLPFKVWLNREKQKGIVIPQKGVTDVYEKSMNGVSENDKEANNKIETNEKKKFLGLNQEVLILSSIIIIGALAYNYFEKK